ncbi:glycosyltransferase family 4 protein [Mycobacterium sp. pV006]|uniref:glycosyltransferase family 4 protein n=1 Tax=Mycobacterium sp. pV006 TaxID=3238983 RepID=UPI00351B6ED3
MPEIFYGGAETQFRILLDRINTQRFDVTVFVEQSHKNSDRTAGQQWMARQTELQFVLCRGLSRDRRLLSASRLSRILIPYLRRRQFDAILVYSAIGLRVTPITRLFGVFTLYSERNEASYSALTRIRKRIYFASANVIVCNSSVAQQNYESYGYRAALIENAVLPPARPRSVRSHQTTGITVLVPGRIAPVKNQELVVRALPELGKSVKRILFAGVIEDTDYFQKLEDSIARLSCAASVEFLGFVKDMDELYESSDLVVLPSRSEGTPNVVLEALVREIPCLAGDIPTNRSVLRNELLFSVDDPNSFAAAVERLTRLSAIEVHNLVASLREYVAERFSERNMVDSYERLCATRGSLSADRYATPIERRTGAKTSQPDANRTVISRVFRSRR